VKIIQVQDCSSCPHLSHTGAFTRGGAKPLCNHPTTVKERLGKEGGLSKMQIPKFPRQPKWCPLVESVLPVITDTQRDLLISVLERGGPYRVTAADAEALLTQLRG